MERPYKADVSKVIHHFGMIMKTQALMMMIWNTESSHSQSTAHSRTQKSAGLKYKSIIRLGL